MYDTEEKIRLLYMDTAQNKVMDIDTIQVIENYAELLNAEELIHVNNMPVRIQGNEYQILYNDHITYSKEYPNSVIKNGQAVAKGNILICRSGKFTKPVSLNDTDVQLIVRSIFRTAKRNKRTGKETTTGLVLSLDPDNSSTIIVTDKNGNEMLN